MAQRHYQELAALREDIDRADAALIGALAARGRLVQKVAELKLRHKIQPRDHDREEQIVARAVEMYDGPLSAWGLERILKAVVDEHRRYIRDVALSETPL